ncbi:MAG: hypothetical protein K8T20_12315 [Planctomycetes bacterium]|nr:hypothetical protein [Planctomycetota bacterium]
MKQLLLLGALALFGCASNDKPAPAAAEAPKDELKLTLTKEGSEIEATADKGTLTIRNVGDVMVEVCDDKLCAPLQPGSQLDFAVNRKAVYHLASAGEGGAKVEVKLVCEGKQGSLTVR